MINLQCENACLTHDDLSSASSVSVQANIFSMLQQSVGTQNHFHEVINSYVKTTKLTKLIVDGDCSICLTFVMFTLFKKWFLSSISTHL